MGKQSDGEAFQINLRAEHVEELVAPYDKIDRVEKLRNDDEINRAEELRPNDEAIGPSQFCRLLQM